MSEMYCTRLVENTGHKNDAKNQSSAHHRTTLSGYIFATKACMDNRKKNLLNSNISSTCPHNIVNFGPLTAEIGWLSSLGHLIKFQRVSRLGFVTAPTSLNSGHPNFVRRLTVSFGGTLGLLYTFGGGELLPANGILPGAKFTLRPSLAFSYIDTAA